MTTITSEYPVLPVRNTVVFPGSSVSLSVGRERSIAAIKAAQPRGDLIVVLTQKDSSQGDPSESQLYRIGTLCKIEGQRGSDQQGFHLEVKGISRFKVFDFVAYEDHLGVHGEVWADRQDGDEMKISVLTRSMKKTAAEILGLIPGETESVEDLIRRLDDPVQLSHLCSNTLDLPIEKKQELLENVSLRSRMEQLLELMREQREALKLQHELKDSLARRLTKEQREGLLREQMKTIRAELGEGEDSLDREYREKIARSQLPKNVRRIALDELRRLSQMSASAPESHTIRNYLDWLCSMPWSKSTSQKIDLSLAKEILEKDHFGLEKVKKRILQHLSVAKLKGDLRGQILCFAGPPGVGKTSLGQSIARALGRKFIRVSLGGVRDEAEIRGHRKTYIGSMPGRIIQSIKRAGTRNPVFILDEIDKLTVSSHGDPAAALLEVLDPEQNREFVDHYLDVPFDLSDVFFIATANQPDSIPAPLLDRMEIIEVSGYTNLEKLNIAKRHLLPKQTSEHGLKADQVNMADETLLHLITKYTRESGVRELNRKLAALCRGVAEEITTADGVMAPITSDWIDKTLNTFEYFSEVSAKALRPGVVTGLAWTPHGGDILFIEALASPGKGSLLLTGQLGDVMKESAQIALTLVRYNLASLGFEFDFDKRDFHVHVPAGAIPKDGPSAGVAMLSAMVSFISHQAIDPKLAMTGEITLRGAVMPVGGIKEKVIAAHRAGMKRVVLPLRNRKDLEEVPTDVRNDLEIQLVDNVVELLDKVLGISFSPLFFSKETRANGVTNNEPHREVS